MEQPKPTLKDEKSDKKPEIKEEEPKSPEDNAGAEKEKAEKIEKIKSVAKEIKALFDAFSDKSILNKYYEAQSSLHNQVYAAAAWSGMFSKEKPFTNNPAESNNILENIESIADQAIAKVGEKKENKAGELFGVLMSMNRLKEELELISKGESVK